MLDLNRVNVNDLFSVEIRLNTALSRVNNDMRTMATITVIHERSLLWVLKLSLTHFSIYEILPETDRVHVYKK